MLEACTEYSLQIPIAAEPVQAVWAQMRLYSANVHGNKAHKHGPPQVHAWAAMLHSVCKIKPEECDESCIAKLREHYMECAQNRERAATLKVPDEGWDL